MNGSMCLIGFQVSRPSIERGVVALLERRVAMRVLVRDDREQQHRREQQEVLKCCNVGRASGGRTRPSRRGCAPRRGAIGAKGSDVANACQSVIAP